MISKINENNPGDLMRLAVTRSPFQNQQLTLLQKKLSVEKKNKNNSMGVLKG